MKKSTTPVAAKTKTMALATPKAAAPNAKAAAPPPAKGTKPAPKVAAQAAAKGGPRPTSAPSKPAPAAVKLAPATAKAGSQPAPEAAPIPAAKPSPTPSAPTPPATPGFQIQDAERLTCNMMRYWGESGKVVSGMMSRVGPMSPSPEMTEASRAFGALAQQWMAEPHKFAAAQQELAAGMVDLWTRTVRRQFGEEVEPLAQPEPGDNRFKDAEWSSHPYFDYWKQAYLLTTRWTEKLVTETDGVDEQTRQRAEFYLRQLSSAASPSNYPLTNPEVVRETLASNGENLVRGMEALADDLANSGATLNISQTDLAAFEVGKNLAMTPGKVVFQNDIIQLIQYTPTTAKVNQVPLLIVPPWINKFYILDLTEQKSFVRYLVGKGFTVFLVSWANPDETLAHKTFENYMREGVLAAADAVSRATKVQKINVLGYCVGGTLLGTTLAWLAARNEDRFRSATFLAAQMDFSKAGDLLVFVDEPQLVALEEMMAERGVLDGSRMAQVFNMLRPRDLIWPYIVNNYLLGKKPMPFDLLYWNQDATRMAAANHAFYLRKFYLENALAKGTLTFAGERLDLSKVKLPVYELATKEDHIAPARSVFLGAALFGGPTQYVMAGSGHIAGVVNPPEKVKYQYFANDEAAGRLKGTFEDWQKSATEHPGSWWPHWTDWLAKQSGGKVGARTPGDGLKVIEDAPGSYVRVKA